MEPRREREGLVRKGLRRGSCKEKSARAKSPRAEVSQGPQLGLRVVGRCGGRSRVRLELVWSALPRVAGKGLLLGWQLREEAELGACRGLKATWKSK